MRDQVPEPSLFSGKSDGIEGHEVTEPSVACDGRSASGERRGGVDEGGAAGRGWEREKEGEKVRGEGRVKGEVVIGKGHDQNKEGIKERGVGGWEEEKSKIEERAREGAGSVRERGKVRVEDKAGGIAGGLRVGEVLSTSDEEEEEEEQEEDLWGYVPRSSAASRDAPRGGPPRGALQAGGASGRRGGVPPVVGGDADGCVAGGDVNWRRASNETRLNRVINAYVRR